jgi:hypothetical protein
VKGPAYAVEEFAKAITIEIVLDVSIIRTIEDVEHSESDPRMLFFDRQSNLSQDLQIGRDKPREP